MNIRSGLYYKIFLVLLMQFICKGLSYYLCNKSKICRICRISDISHAKMLITIGTAGENDAKDTKYHLCKIFPYSYVCAILHMSLVARYLCHGMSKILFSKT